MPFIKPLKTLSACVLLFFDKVHMSSRPYNEIYIIFPAYFSSLSPPAHVALSHDGPKCALPALFHNLRPQSFA